VVSIADRSYF